MAEHKVFTKEELAFLYQLFSNHGCINTLPNGTELRCPHWDSNAISETGEEGDCSTFTSNQLCRAIQMGMLDEYRIVLREVEPEDLKNEREQQQRQLQSQIVGINRQIQGLELQRDKLQVKANSKKRAGGEDGNQESKSTSNN